MPDTSVAAPATSSLAVVLTESHNTQPSRAPRDAPIRQAILSFVTVPRSAGEIARHIDRPIPTATGHLRAACKLGLTKRIARSFYVVTDYLGEAPVQRAVKSRPQHEIALRTTLIRLLQQTRTEHALVGLANARAEDVRFELDRFWLNGWLIGSPLQGLQLRDHVKRRFSRSIRNSSQ